MKILLHKLLNLFFHVAPLTSNSAFTDTTSGLLHRISLKYIFIKLFKYYAYFAI